MNFFNRQKTRSPGETVRALRESVLRLDQSSGEARKRVSGYALSGTGSWRPSAARLWSMEENVVWNRRLLATSCRA
jgi:calcium binding protein 39